MLRLFQAGVIAALMQGVAILLATLLVFSYAHRIRRASRLMNPSDPDRAANTLMISLRFAAMGFAAVSLGPPPSFLTEHGWHLSYFDAAPIIWSGMMSIGVASFGANAQAAALKQ
jgi:hypothetical protein